MTEEEWKVFGELMQILKDRFDDQEKRIKHLEEQIEMFTKLKELSWIFEMDGMGKNP
jgi:hypothetical protein